jgi:hypothetical protein
VKPRLGYCGARRDVGINVLSKTKGRQTVLGIRISGHPAMTEVSSVGLTPTGQAEIVLALAGTSNPIVLARLHEELGDSC